MRRKNWRVVMAGGLAIVLAVGFFLFMMTMAPKSNDPAAMMATVGQVSGVVGAIGLVMVVVGLIGKKTAT
jgi:succinate dehydrogenase hydrophobic anchor subunit